MRTKGMLKALVILVTSGCAGVTQPPPTTAAVISAVAIGRLMYEHDLWAAQASDAMFAQLSPQAPRPDGWVTEDVHGVGTVTFPAPDGTTALYQVTFPEAERRPVFEILPPGTPMTPVQSAMLAARQAALAARFQPCSNRYNTIVLPASLLRKDGWLVYLVPAGTEPDVIRVGGHYRVHVSADGRHVQSVTPLSSSCLVMKPQTIEGDDFTVEGIAVTHHATDGPTESHVFLNYLHRIDIVIGAKSGIWRLHQGHAIWIDEIE
jgi:hypothetical protein